MYTVTPEAVSKAISVCRQQLTGKFTGETVKGVSFALEVLEMVLGGTKEVEQPKTIPVPVYVPPNQQQPIQLPPNILNEWLEGEKEDR
jgi:hypothetical protein